MSKKIIFKALSKHESEIFLPPYPASKSIPTWWREETPYQREEGNEEGKKFNLKNRISNATFKKCTPMLDAITSGYIIPLYADVHVVQENGFPNISWRVTRDPFELHGPSSRNVEPPVGYKNVVFKYLNTWIPITPSGYSTLVIPPVGHRQLPFHAIPAIIDTDRSLLDVNFPVWVKENFEGIVEKGTPIAQLIPFKRDNWEMDISYYQDGEHHKNMEKTFNSTLVGHYIKNIWSRKEFK